MRLDRFALRAFSPAFPGELELPIGDLPQGLIAIVGVNGAGKTTFLDGVAGTIYRQMPSADGADPVSYATARDSFTEVEFTIPGAGRFVARLSLDGPKRKSDAVLTSIDADGRRVPLNPDGKVSTYDELIASRFPSFNLFINGPFAAQGRGDQFARTKPAGRKDLFAEFLGLTHYARMAAAAGEAAELCADAVLRLTVRLEALERDTAAPLLEALEQQADALQTQGGEAEARKRELVDVIARLEAREKLSADQVAAFTAAQQRAQACRTEIAAREAERAALTAQRTSADQASTSERSRLEQKRDGDLARIARQRAEAAAGLDDERLAIDRKRAAVLAELDEKLQGNATIRAMEAEIVAAVKALPEVEALLVAARAGLQALQTTRETAAASRRDLERQLAALLPVEQSLQRAQSDANLLLDVPCGGEGEYAACQFLVNAKAAQDQIGALAAQVRPKELLADQVAARTREIDTIDRNIGAAQTSIKDLEATRAKHAERAKYEAALQANATRVQELTNQRAAAIQTADEQAAAAQLRHDAWLRDLAADEARIQQDAGQQLTDAADRHRIRLAEIETQATTLEQTIARLAADRATAQADLEAATAGNMQAVRLQAELLEARAEWDQVIAAQATVASGVQTLHQRRQEIAVKRVQLADARQRLARVQTELLEWKDLQKAFGKSGLPELEIDAAGPEITVRTNAILESCIGPRYTVELVTQVPNAQGTGVRDEFTVRVIDNEHPASGWRDISRFSGGQKTILQEALMCAISLYVNERAPFPIETLWRDETGGALDGGNALRYIAMLRKVRELGRLHHVFFVSHNPEAAALADVQIRIADGTARIVYPPFVDAEVAA